MTQIVILITDLWFGQFWNLTAVVFLGVLMLVGAVIATKTFRWE